MVHFVSQLTNLYSKNDEFLIKNDESWVISYIARREPADVTPGQYGGDVSKYDEFCINDEDFYIKNLDLCI